MCGLAVFDDVLQGFLQDAVETQSDFGRYRVRDVLDVNVNLDSVATGQLFAEAGHRRCQPQEFQSRRVKAVRQRLHVRPKCRNLSSDCGDLLLEIRADA